MYNKREIIETIRMIQEQNLDVRTITMGISLIDCADSDIDKSCEKVYNKIVEDLNLGEVLNQRAKTLSGGYKRRLSIGISLISQPKILFLDEPTIGVDAENLKNLHLILKKLKEQLVTIVLITHDAEFCNDLFDYKLSLIDVEKHEFMNLRGETNE